jgi:hypothetical protein
VKKFIHVAFTLLTGVNEKMPQFYFSPHIRSLETSLSHSRSIEKLGDHKDDDVHKRQHTEGIKCDVRHFVARRKKAKKNVIKYK